MASTYSFDIVSDFDQQELVNAIDQTVRNQKPLRPQRYSDHYGLGEQAITVNTDSEFNLDATPSLQTKAAKRDLSLKIFDYGKVDSASGNRVRQEIKLKKGISQEIAKQITKLIRDEFKRCSLDSGACLVKPKTISTCHAAFEARRLASTAIYYR